MSTQTKFVKNFLSLTIADFISRGISLVLVVYIARFLGPTLLGQLSFAQIFFTYISLLVNMGFVTYGIREIAKNPEKIKIIASNILSSRFLIALFLNLLLIPFFASFKNLASDKILLILYTIAVLPLSVDLSFVFRGLNKMEYVGIIQVITQLFYSISALVLVVIYKNIIVIPAVIIITLSFGSILTYVILNKKFDGILEKVKLRMNVLYLKESFPIGLTAFLTQIYFNFDSIALNFYRGSSEVGYYNSAYKIILILVSLGSFFVGALFPFTSQNSDNKEQFNRLVTKSIRFLTLGGGAIAILGIVFGDFLILKLYGENYSQAGYPFRILSLLPLLTYIGGLFSDSLTAMGRQKQMLVAVFVGALFNIVFNMLLVKDGGMLIASIIRVVSEIIVLTMLVFNFCKEIRIFFITHIFKILIIGVIILIVYYTTQGGNQVFSFLLSSVLFMVLSYILKLINKEDFLLFPNMILAVRNKKNEYKSKQQ